MEKELIEEEEMTEKEQEAGHKEIERDRVQRKEKELTEQLAANNRKIAMEYMETAKKLMMEAEEMTNTNPESVQPCVKWSMFERSTN